MKQTTITYGGRPVRVVAVRSLGNVPVAVRRDLVVLLDAGSDKANEKAALEALAWLDARHKNSA